MPEAAPPRQPVADSYDAEHLYPYPIARLVRRARTSRTAVDRLGYYHAAIEATLKLTAAVSLSAASAEVSNFTAVRDLRRPSTGAWLTLVQALRAPLGTIHQPDALVSTLTDVEVHQRFDGAARRVIESRNQFVHGGAMTEEGAERFAPGIESDALSALRALYFYSRLRFLYCEEVLYRGPERFDVTVRLCNGSDPIFPFETWRLKAPLPPNSCLLVSDGGEVAYDASPLVRVTVDARRPDGRIFWFFQQRRRQSVEYHVYDSNSQTADVEQDSTPETTEAVDAVLAGQLGAYRARDCGFSSTAPPSLVLSAGLHAGERVGRYKLIGQLSSGESANVYIAEDERNGEHCVVKFLNDRHSHQPHAQQRHNFELQAYQALAETDAAVPLLDTLQDEQGRLVIVLAYAPDGSLYDRIAQDTVINETDVLRFARSAAVGLSILHEAGYLHRDVKLSNLLVWGDGVRLCDFATGADMSRFSVDRTTRDGERVGTLGYMAPEVLAGEPPSPQSDLYGLGVCIAFLIAGYELLNPRAWLIEYEPSSPVQQALRQVTLGMLEPLAENRPPSAAAVMVRFEAPEREAALAVSGGLRPNALVVASSSDANWVDAHGKLYRRIEPGTALLGGTRYPDERPVHAATFSEPIGVASTPVTNREFQVFIKKTGYSPTDRRFLLHLRQQNFEPRWRVPDAPVTFVSWYDAGEYALWLSELTGADLRLLTESEWEHACRCNTRTVYPWGNQFEVGRMNCNDAIGSPTPVGAYAANRFGLHDMLGNVWEWCIDVKDVVAKEESLAYRRFAELGQHCVDPCNDGEEALRSTRVAADERVARGGSFASEPRNARPANRRGFDERMRTRSVGFRLCVRGVFGS